MSETKHRIYGQCVDIKEEKTRDLYDRRAEKLAEMDNPYVSVLLGDQNPEYALAWNEFEKKVVLPKMQVGEESRVLDIGCGIGRWAESLIPLCRYYCGTDMSSGMIERARERNRFPEKEYDFINDSFENFCRTPKAEMKYSFDRLWICGVMMYINDRQLELGMECLLDKMDDHALVYFTETVAFKERLTLNEFFSSALKADYNVIYRTEDEYNRIYGSWLQAGFHIKEQGLQPHFNQEEQYSETDRWYTILER